MSDSMFQKEINDEIFVKDIDLPNPSPERLDARIDISSQTFSAKPGWVLKSVYSSANSLDAFSSDDEVQVYLSYSRKADGADTLFFQHTISASGDESVAVLGYEQLSQAAKSGVPGNFRR